MHRRKGSARVLRRAAMSALAVLVLGSLAPVGAHADTKKELAKAKKELDALVVKINTEQGQLDALTAKLHDAQADLNASATAIDGAQSQYAVLEGKVMAIRQAFDDAKAHYRRVRNQLNE